MNRFKVYMLGFGHPKKKSQDNVGEIRLFSVKISHYDIIISIRNKTFS